MTFKEKELKIEWLRSYRSYYYAYNSCLVQIAELRGNTNKLISSYDPTPPSGNFKGPENTWVKVIEKQDELIKEIEATGEKMKQRYSQIQEAINELDPVEALVLVLRYVEDLEWNEVVKRIPFYSDRQIYRYHSKALEHLQLPSVVEI